MPFIKATAAAALALAAGLALAGATAASASPRPSQARPQASSYAPYPGQFYGTAIAPGGTAWAVGYQRRALSAKIRG